MPKQVHEIAYTLWLNDMKFTCCSRWAYSDLRNLCGVIWSLRLLIQSGTGYTEIVYLMAYLQTILGSKSVSKLSLTKAMLLQEISSQLQSRRRLI